jgi:hypothetical protein
MSAAWYDSNWRCRVKFTIPAGKVTAAISPFRLYTSGAGLPADFWGLCQASGGDLLFTLGDGRTVIPHDRPHFDPALGAMETHVRLPSVSNIADTEGYLYFGNATCADQQNVSAVWSGNYSGVWHLGESATGTGTADVYKDSTGAANHGADYVSPGGKVGKLFPTGGETLDGSNDYISFPNAFTLTDYSLSFWLYLTAPQPARWRTIIGAQVGSTYEYDLSSSDNKINAYSQGQLLSTFSLNEQAWYHLVLTVDHLVGSDLYINGALNNSNTNKSGLAAQKLQLGSWRATQYLPAVMDEARISPVVRSAAEIAATYSNQNAPANFISWGPLEGGAGIARRWLMGRRRG